MGAEACSKLLSLGWRLGGNEENSEVYFEDGKSMAERGGNDVLLTMTIGIYAGFRGVTLGYANDYLRFRKQAADVALATGNDELAFATLN